LFRLNGYSKPISDSGSSAKARSTLMKQVDEFKRVVRGVASRIFLNEGDACLFQPCKQPPDSLLGVGILGKQTTLSFNVMVCPAVAKDIAKRLVCLNRKVSKNVVEDFLNKKKKLIPHIIRSRGKSAWDSSFKINQESVTRISVWHGMYSAEAKPPRRETAFFKCPNSDCNKWQASNIASFQRKDLDIKVRCRFCLKHEAVKRWRCACGVIWHTCAIHSCHYCGDDTTLKRTFAIDSDTETGQEKHARNATGMAEPDYDALLASDTRRAKESKQRDKRKAGAIALGSSSSMPKKPTVLGPILSARFPGITSSSSR
jgi:hypothetical protein